MSVVAFVPDNDDFFRDPLAAARQAEVPFRLSHSQPSPNLASSWQLLCRAVHGRILSLSEFSGFDTLIRFVERHQRVFSEQPNNLPVQIREEVQVAMFGMLVFRQPGHARIGEYAQRCERIVDQHGYTYVRLTAANYLVLYHIWRGDLLAAEALRQRMAPLRMSTREPHALLISYSIDAMVRRLFLDFDACEAAVTAGLALAVESGVHVWDSHFHMQRAYLSLSRNNLRQAAAQLDDMRGSAPPTHHLDRAGYHFCRAWCCCAAGNMPEALSNARQAVQRARRAGAVFPIAVTRMGLAQLHLERGLPHLALWQMGRVGLTGRSMASIGVPFAQGLVRAHLALKFGLRRQAAVLLRGTLRLGREQQYLNFPWWRNDAMSELCALALEKNVEPDYVQRLIYARRLAPPRGLSPPGWRKPLRVRAADPLPLQLDGAPLLLPPEETTLLVALAEAEGAMPVMQAVNRLWPEGPADGMARLHRLVSGLRQRLGSEQMLRCDGETLSLDSGLVELDAVA